MRGRGENASVKYKEVTYLKEKKKNYFDFLKNINYFRKMPLYENHHVIHGNYSIHFCLILANNYH